MLKEALDESVVDGFVAHAALDNRTNATVRMGAADEPWPVMPNIYQLDGVVRRAPALQKTLDARHPNVAEDMP